MRRLLPVADPAGEPDVDLIEAYAYPPGRTWLRANMVASLDGAAQAPDGLSAGLSSPADKRIFGVLRGLADVVVVGAGTVRAEGYRPPRAKPAYAAARAAAGQLPAPVIAIVSRSLALDFTAPLFTEALTPTIVITCEQAPPENLAAAGVHGDVLVAGREQVDLASALDTLAARGLTRQLTEGGPRVLGRLAACGRLDELCLTLSPLLTAGPADRILTGPELAEGLSMRPASLLEEDGSLFARYIRA
ncbi:pyrimidine reductase family protein [Embleya sp. AB8]|uniref:pyrimidine reductase family protein n=1 Tax=Embleya sp. AB8 TaxID=3156304 RepID=UPI003C751C97